MQNLTAEAKDNVLKLLLTDRLSSLIKESRELDKRIQIRGIKLQSNTLSVEEITEIQKEVEADSKCTNINIKKRRAIRRLTRLLFPSRP